MEINHILESERKQLRKIQKFQLPTSFKTIGIITTVLASVALIALGVFVEDAVTFKLLAKKAMLIGLLIASVAKDKTEDELTILLRSQSYTLAFVIGVVYAMVQPDVNYFVGSLFSNGESYAELSSFQVLWFMLMIQLCIFTLLKKVR